MCALHRRLFLLPMILSGIMGSSVWAGEERGEVPGGFRFEVVGPVEVRLSGSSTLNDWSCLGNRIEIVSRFGMDEGDFRRAVDATWSGDLPTPLAFHEIGEMDGPPLKVRIPIDSLQCSRSRMQRDLREAVRYEEHPKISYELEMIRGVDHIEEGGEAVKLAVTGQLTVAGVSRKVEHEVQVTRLEGGAFRAEGRLDLKMTWFDMTPPTALLGLLRAHDAFSVAFNLEARALENRGVQSALMQDEERQGVVMPRL